MSEEFKLKSLSDFRIYNRIAYALLIVFTLLVRGSEITKSTYFLVYYLITFVVLLILDETVFNPNRSKLPTLLFQIRLCLFVGIVCFGAVFTMLPPVFLCIVIAYIFFLLAEDLFFSDTFNTLFNYFKRFLLGLYTGLMLFVIHYSSQIKGVWMLISFEATLILASAFVLSYAFYYRAISFLDDRYTRLYFRNADMIAENKKLMNFQERVEKVNNEINYQKINLTKANDDLAKINEETRSLIDVMKYFSASFDVEKNAHYMLSNVVNIKETGAVALYIDKNVYMNEEPYLEVISENTVAETLLRQDIYNIYEAIKKRKSLAPLVLCDNYDFKYPFLTGGNMCNAVVFPAYENDYIYGVMVVTSSKYDFFENGYAFYESSIMDFTSALISDRLYLQTEDMAKKDGLTKIYNRIYFNQFYPELKEEVAKSGDTFSVCMLDIDHFKRVNDTYGHLAGDEVIKAVAKVDNDFAKKYNGTAVRYGGEEFLLILRGKGVEETLGILKEMHEIIKGNVVEFEDYRINVNSSMGIACYPETCSDINDVLDRSDKAMYYSKEHGRGRITIDGREGE
ncbi:MAG: diguanylate cyclase [Eubacterium sp.]|nr:diguanylate cyclase [Eubacterium sp.]